MCSVLGFRTSAALGRFHFTSEGVKEQSFSAGSAIFALHGAHSLGLFFNGDGGELEGC